MNITIDPLSVLKKRNEGNQIARETTPLSTLIFKKLPDLPPPPKYIIDLCIQKAQTREFFYENQASYKQRVLKNWGGKYNGPVGRIQHGHISAEFDQWAQENIGPGFYEAGAGWINFKPGMPPSIGGHTDRTRDGVIAYNLLRGGPDAELLFWREKGHDYVRTTRGLSFESDDDLEPILKVKDWDTGWHWINPLVIHGLENITDLYMHVVVDFNVLPERLAQMIND